MWDWGGSSSNLAADTYGSSDCGKLDSMIKYLVGRMCLKIAIGSDDTGSAYEQGHNRA